MRLPTTLMKAGILVAMLGRLAHAAAPHRSPEPKAEADRIAVAVPALITALSDRSADARFWAAEGLGSLGRHLPPAAVAALINAVRTDSDKEVRERAATALGQAGPAAAAETVPVLIALLGDEKRVSRFHVVAALGGGIGPAAKSALPAILSTLDDQDGPDGYFTLLAVKAIGPVGKAEVPAMVKLLEKKKALVRVLAVAVLAETGPAAREAVPALLALAVRDPTLGAMMGPILRKIVPPTGK